MAQARQRAGFYDAGMIQRLNPTHLLRYAGLFTWACVGLPLLLSLGYRSEDGLPGSALLAWGVAHLAFGLGYAVLTLRLGRAVRPLNVVLLAQITLCAIAVSHFSGSGLGGGLLLVISGILPWVLGLRLGLVWLLLQHAALVPVFAGRVDFTLMEAGLQAVFYIGYSMLAFVTGHVARQQARARQEQRRLISELRATQALLAESSRVNERTRISRELHDLLGHHLTALSLNLEVATHLSEGRAREQVQQARLLARLLLTDVREAVSQLRQDDVIDLSTALAVLVQGVPALRIHLDLPARLPVSDPGRAQVLLRCVQEIITNTLRHAGADNLWIRLRPEADGIALRAHDDGRGSDAFAAGNGLRGMRERLAEYHGRLEVNPGAGRGFALDAFLPMEMTA